MPAALILDEDDDLQVSSSPAVSLCHGRRLNSPHFHSQVRAVSRAPELLNPDAAVIPQDDSEGNGSMGPTFAHSCQSQEGTASLRFFFKALSPPAQAQFDDLNPAASLRRNADFIVNNSAADCSDILVVMRSLPNDLAVQTLACERLWIQSWDDVDADRMSKDGAIPLLLAAMTRFPNHARLQRSACETLQNLVAAPCCGQQNSQDICHQGGVFLMVQAMMQHVNDTGLLLCGCSALASLASSHVSHRDLIIHAGGLQAILESLRHHPHHQGLKLESDHALKVLGYSNTTC